jgi:anaerobic selenocysteine-containing dehydrogenase
MLKKIEKREVEFETWEKFEEVLKEAFQTGSVAERARDKRGCRKVIGRSRITSPILRRTKPTRISVVQHFSSFSKRVFIAISYETFTEEICRRMTTLRCRKGLLPSGTGKDASSNISLEEDKTEEGLVVEVLVVEVVVVVVEDGIGPE